MKTIQRKRRRVVHKTVLGHVVYKRKTHIMTVNDAVRIATNVIMEPGKDLLRGRGFIHLDVLAEFLTVLIERLIRGQTAFDEQLLLSLISSIISLFGFKQEEKK